MMGGKPGTLVRVHNAPLCKKEPLNNSPMPIKKSGISSIALVFVVIINNSTEHSMIGLLNAAVNLAVNCKIALLTEEEARGK